jgi:hypothetical protein
VLGERRRGCHRGAGQGALSGGDRTGATLGAVIGEQGHAGVAAGEQGCNTPGVTVTKT